MIWHIIFHFILLSSATVAWLPPCDFIKYDYCEIECDSPDDANDLISLIKSILLRCLFKSIYVYNTHC